MEFLLIPEIPLWPIFREQLANPQVIALAKQMIQEMIEQAGNHPSIFAWSVSNESDMSTPGGRAYFHTMKEWVNQLDPGRLVTFADNDIAYGADPAKEAANDADFIMMNEYYGAWNGPEEGLSHARSGRSPVSRKNVHRVRVWNSWSICDRFRRSRQAACAHARTSADAFQSTIGSLEPFFGAIRITNRTEIYFRGYSAGT